MPRLLAQPLKGLTYNYKDTRSKSLCCTFRPLSLYLRPDCLPSQKRNESGTPDCNIRSRWQWLTRSVQHPRGTGTGVSAREQLRRRGSF